MEEDIITSLRFDHSGNYLAVGDKAGRVIVFEAQNAKKGQPNYEYFTEFQSHIKEFDPLRSMEIDE
jgi:serine/threonine-protein phosphatase 2A regulatory subunit B